MNATSSNTVLAVACGYRQKKKIQLSSTHLRERVLLSSVEFEWMMDVLYIPRKTYSMQIHLKDFFKNFTVTSKQPWTTQQVPVEGTHKRRHYGPWVPSSKLRSSKDWPLMRWWNPYSTRSAINGKRSDFPKLRTSLARKLRPSPQGRCVHSLDQIPYFTCVSRTAKVESWVCFKLLCG